MTQWALMSCLYRDTETGAKEYNAFYRSDTDPAVVVSSGWLSTSEDAEIAGERAAQETEI